MTSHMVVREDWVSRPCHVQSCGVLPWQNTCVLLLCFDHLAMLIDLQLLRLDAGFMHLGNRLKLRDLKQQELQVLRQVAETFVGLVILALVVTHGIGNPVDVLHVRLQVLGNHFLNDLVRGFVVGVGKLDRGIGSGEFEGQRSCPTNGQHQHVDAHLLLHLKHRKQSRAVERLSGSWDAEIQSCLSR